MSRKRNLNPTFQNFKEYQKHNHNNENILVVSKNLVSTGASVVILPRKVYFFLPRVSHFIIAPQMLSTKRGSKWCSCYGWLWVFPKPFYLNSSLKSTPGGRQRYFFIDSIQSVAVLFCSIWDDDDHQGHLGLKCRGAAEMCCITGSTSLQPTQGTFFHRNSRIAQDGWSWGGGRD